MTIHALQPINLFGAHPSVEQQIGRALCFSSMQHFTQFLGQTALGISYNSCNAAVAINLDAEYGQVNLGIHQFSVLYGSSRLFSGLDPDYFVMHGAFPTRPFSSSLLGEHAEQSAIRLADARNIGFFVYNGHNHIYIDLTPCGNCHAWLQADPRSWYVHYFAQLNAQKPVTEHKKRMRAKEFGRQMEPRPKKLKT